MNKPFVLVVLVCLGCFSAATVVAVENPATIIGEILTEESDSCRGMVSMWPVNKFSAFDHEKTDLIPPWVGPVKPDCSFQINVTSGSYYLWAILRKSPGGDFGPLRSGDQIFMFPETGDDPQPVQVQAGQRQHVGSSSSFREFSGHPEQVETGIIGYLSDSAGSPLVDHVVQAFATKDMSGQPLAVSGGSDSAGHFKLRLHKGEFYLLARDQFGFGVPQPGRMSGTYGGNSAKVVKLRQREVVEGVEILLTPLEVDAQIAR